MIEYSGAASVIPIGCRADVERAAANDNGSDGRRKIYIVDGDLDLLARGRHEKVPNLHRLSVYAVENLVLSSESVSSYADIVCPHLTSAEASSRVGVDDVLKNVRTYGAGYFPIFAVSRRPKLRGNEFRIMHTDVCRSEKGRYVEIDPSKLRAFLRVAIKSIISSVGLRRYRLAKQFVRERIATKGLDAIHFVSAKHITLKILNDRVASVGGSALKQGVIVSTLANNTNVIADRALVLKLRALFR